MGVAVGDELFEVFDAEVAERCDLFVADAVSGRLRDPYRWRYPLASPRLREQLGDVADREDMRDGGHGSSGALIVHGYRPPIPG